MKTIHIGKIKYRLRITRKYELLDHTYVLIQQKKPFGKWATADGEERPRLYQEALLHLKAIRRNYEFEQANKKRKTEFAEIPVDL